MILLNIAIVCIMVIYGIAMLLIFLQSLTHGYLIHKYLQPLPQKKIENLHYSTSELPIVTIQLPIYNEAYVVERLLESATKIIYPKNKLEIQILDDSTDDCSSTIKKLVQQYQQDGFNMVHIKRIKREGFKAGALAHGLQLAKGSLIAVFDADFVPQPNFLTDTVDKFTNASIGMVQTRWGHLNEQYSLLTKLQAFGLNAHFTVEQSGRFKANCFFNFNGTSGIWRKQCILDAGNWQSDTLTEDLDLSYRAQLKGWQFCYVEESVHPAELPPAMGAFKSQQYRWMKGGAETAVKHIPTILKADISFKQKWNGVAHLMASSFYLIIFLTALLSVPMLMIKNNFATTKWFFSVASFFTIGIFVFALYYVVASIAITKNKKAAFKIFIQRMPLFLSFNMGLSMHNGIAVLEGLLGKKTPFIRTPKFNTNTIENKYIVQSINWKSGLELLLILYFIVGIVLGFYYKDYGLMLYHLLLIIGFGIVSYYTFFPTTFLKNSLVKAKK